MTLALLLVLSAAPPLPLLPVKEPAYQSGSPRYAVLTFGTDRVWVVLDGDTLILDRDGDGDLTGDTKRKQAVSRLEGRDRIFEFGNLRRVGGKKAQLRIISGKDGERVSLTVGGRNYRTVMPGPKGLRFAARPQDAPVLPFDGPLRVVAVWPNRFVLGEECNITAHIGTPLPGGGYVAVCEGWPPKDAHPVAELAFASKTKGGPPIRVKVALESRC
ncbi:MAG: hypothetical protein K2W96_14350 [Gemmataceae bacterium]|nr:hypothetical protein [Gemmataceae bacterium]